VRAAVLLFAAALSCSPLVYRQPEPDQRCTSNASAALMDAIIGSFAIVGAVAATAEGNEGGGASNVDPRLTFGVVAAAFAASATYGFIARQRCLDKIERERLAGN